MAVKKAGTIKKGAVKSGLKKPGGTGSKSVHDSQEAKDRFKEEQTFDLFVFWRSLSPIAKGRSPAEMAMLGVEDPLAMELFGVKYQKDFAKKYKVSEPTLSEWNKKIADEGLVGGHSLDWAKQLTSNILMSLYRKALVHGDAPRARFWYEVVEGYRPGIDITSGGKPIGPLVLPEREAVGGKKKKEK